MIRQLRKILPLTDVTRTVVKQEIFLTTEQFSPGYIFSKLLDIVWSRHAFLKDHIKTNKFSLSLSVNVCSVPYLLHYCIVVQFSNKKEKSSHELLLCYEKLNKFNACT